MERLSIDHSFGSMRGRQQGIGLALGMTGGVKPCKLRGENQCREVHGLKSRELQIRSKGIKVDHQEKGNKVFLMFSFIVLSDIGIFASKLFLLFYQMKLVKRITRY